VKVTVTALDTHPTEGHPGEYHSYEQAEGQHVIVGHFGVILDGKHVIVRDRRMKVNREPGHPWIAFGRGWTSFTVDVEP
jgi:hypothetical protein